MSFLGLELGELWPSFLHDTHAPSWVWLSMLKEQEEKTTSTKKCSAIFPDLS